ncbi:MAG: MlaD family protein, partial [Gemmatimonadales bacterium]
GIARPWEDGGRVDTKQQDLMVGALLVAAIAVVVGALIATSGWGERRYDIYMRAGTAQDLNVDTRVTLLGLEVGKVASVSPRVDSLTRAVSFIVRLRVAERFPDGSSLKLPVGTSAEVVQVSPLAAPVIQLHLPVRLGPANLVLAEGDTIDSRRSRSVVDQLGEIAESVSVQVRQTLAVTERMMRRVTGAFGQAEATIRDERADIRAGVASLTRAVERLDTLLATTNAGMGPLQDSLAGTLGASRTLLARLDTTLSENRGDLRSTVTDLRTMSRQMLHLIDQLSRRPYRILTGVKPIPLDSATPPPPTPTSQRTRQP